MRLGDLEESSGYSFEGSITDDLLISKMWLCKTLQVLGHNKFSTVYILGSWYGNMALVLDRMGIEYDKIINVEVNKEWLTLSKELLNRADVNSEFMLKDANKLDYRQLDKDSLIINTSVPDIKGNQWWSNIPKGTLVALQCRDNIPEEKHSSLKDFTKDYPMSKVKFAGELSLEDPETKYNRFMLIGTK